ncbi:MAG TPA: hypothetical protein VIR34_02440 [Gemmatimonadaceae bacterium]|jgi:hypothetical protein
MRRLVQRLCSAGSTIGLATVLTLGSSFAAQAQSIALEAGLAGIENYDAFNPMFGVAGYSPEWHRLSASFSYSRWGGRDGNEERIGGLPRIGYGNQAFILAALVRVLGERTVTFSLGGGLGMFQAYAPVGEHTESRYDNAAMGTFVLRYLMKPRFAPYLRGDVQLPTDEGPIHYGLARVGFEVSF